MIWITRIERTHSRVVCYWNTSEVRKGKLKYNKERIRKTSQTIQINRNKTRKTKHMEKKLKNTNENKTGKNNEKIHINNKMPALWDSKVTFVLVLNFLV